METAEKTVITIQATVNAPVTKVWNYWTAPEHVINWNSPSEDWHTPRAENDLSVGGKFNYRMEARDGSMGFDFGGVYDEIKEHAKITYTLGDGRKVINDFTPGNNTTNIVVNFEAETQNPVEMQRAGWQAILDNFKQYTENS